MHTILHITYLQYTAALQFCGGRYLRLHYATAITCIYIIYNRCKHTFFAIFVKILKNIRYFTKILIKTLAYIKKPPYLCNVKFKGHDSKQRNQPYNITFDLWLTYNTRCNDVYYTCGGNGWQLQLYVYNSKQAWYNTRCIIYWDSTR